MDQIEQKGYIRTLNDIICRNMTGIGDKWPLFVLPSCCGNEHPSFKGYRSSHHLSMVYHTEPPDLFNFNYKQGKDWNKCQETDQYMER